MKRAGAVFFALGIMLLGAGPAAARRATFNAQGEAVTAGNPAQVRVNAFGNALKSAVEQAAQSLGGPKEGADPAVDKAIYERASSFVPKYTVITENSEDNVL